MRLARRQVWTMGLMQRGLACSAATPTAYLYMNSGASVGFALRTNPCIWGCLSPGARGRAGSTGLHLHPELTRAMATSSGAAKQKTEYVCTQCDDRSFQWSGRCRSCGAWGRCVWDEVWRLGHCNDTPEFTCVHPPTPPSAWRPWWCLQDPLRAAVEAACASQLL